MGALCVAVTLLLRAFRVFCGYLDESLEEARALRRKDTAAEGANEISRRYAINREIVRNVEANMSYCAT